MEGSLQGPLFRTIGRGTDALTATPLPRANAYAMVRRGAAVARIATKIGNHTFRATGITAYLKNGRTLENAAAMTNHASTPTTQLYERRRDDVTPERGGAHSDLSFEFHACHGLSGKWPGRVPDFLRNGTN